MSQFTVQIPGTTDAFTVYAESDAEAIAEALRAHGLTFAPPGTRAAPAADHSNPGSSND